MDAMSTALARMIDHTLLSPEATPDDVRELCAEATALGTATVCVSPSQLPIPSEWLGNDVGVCTVIGFPSGAHHSSINAAEAALAVRHGADEIDLVINLGLVKSGQFDAVADAVAVVRGAVDEAAVARRDAGDSDRARPVLKLIIESAVLTDAEIVGACDAAVRGGADFVKTSTGFHPAGGASVAAVSLMAATVGGRLGIKASGGIRDGATAMAMINAGATRIGASRSADIIASVAASRIDEA